MQSSTHKRFMLAALIWLLSASVSANSELGQNLQSVLDSFIAENPNIPGVMASFDSDPMNLHWQGAAGVTKPGTENPMTPDLTLRLASTTKTYVAAAILRLMEQGKLDLDDAISGHLPEHQLQLLKANGHVPEAITIRHLLTHTSGLRDHATSEAYVNAVLADPGHNWSRDEQLQLAMQQGAPYGPPGHSHHYSDTGYILLGEIIEQSAGLKLGPALRQLLKFDELGLASTWLESQEPAPANASPRTSQYLDDIDSRDWNPSFDLYGGGGLVTNMPDLARFYKALFEGKVFEYPKTLASMRTGLITDYGGPVHFKPGYGRYQYCLGLYALEYRDLTVFLHGGFWGTRGGYVPALGLAFGIAVNQQRSGPQQQELFEALLDVVINSKQ